MKHNSATLLIVLVLSMFNSCGKVENLDVTVLLPEVSGPANIQGFGSYSGDRQVDLYWTTGRPIDDFPTDPERPAVKAVKIFMSDINPEDGFTLILERDHDGIDSTRVDELTNGRNYYFRLATYDSMGEPIGLSSPLMTTPGKIPQPILTFPAEQAENPRYVANISWSSDGREIAFIQETTSQKPNIYIFNFETNTIEQITNYSDDNYRIQGVTWSPDNQKLAYCYTQSRTAGLIDYRIWTIAIASGEIQKITSGRVDFDPAWETNQNIIFCKGTYEPPNIPELYKVNLSAIESETALTTGQIIYKYNPSVSPDGELVAVSGTNPGYGGRVLYLISPSGGELTSLTGHQYNWKDIQPSWALDGSLIAFSSNRSGHYEIWSIDMSSGYITQITRGLTRDVKRYNPKWSPDGNQMAMIEKSQSGYIISIIPRTEIGLLESYSIEKE